jgi:cellulose synthase/poly-beta-1,6-N-acetylglucosamine synthase-like glycosyltransferase
MIIIFLVALLFVCYGILMNYYLRGWKSLPDFFPSNSLSGLKVSVIIPARNEEQNMGSLLSALQRQTYSKDLVEIIVVDDHSNDKTVEVVGQFPGVRLLQLKDDNINSYKKKALETGIAAATGSLIVTTDADCLPTEDWIATLVSFQDKTASTFIVAPVVLDENGGMLQLFQAMDFMILQGITASSVHLNMHAMCNGANLAYDRSAFLAVKGFEGIDGIASGDDMLLMHKMKTAFPGKIGYLKSEPAIVRTKPMTTWSAFFNQRIRWASKARHYQDKSIFWALLLVYLFNFSFLLLLIAGFRNHLYWMAFMLLLFAKATVELPFFNSVKKFYRKSWGSVQFFLFQPVHIAYTILSGIFGQLGRYEWKGRSVK